jgi:hypothetical protein
MKFRMSLGDALKTMSTTVLFDKRLEGSERLRKGKSEINFKGMLMARFKKLKSILVRAKSMKKRERRGGQQ